MAPPSQIARVGNPANPQPFLTSANPICGQWKSLLEQLGQQTSARRSINPNIPAVRWNVKQKTINYAAAMTTNPFAGNLDQLGRNSGNPNWQDLANLAAAYRRAFAEAVPTYTPADNHLANAANYLSTTVLGACAIISRI